MKKKTGLFKIIICVLLAITVLTWIVPASYYTSGSLTDLGMYRIGFFDFFQLLFGTFEFSYFLQILILIVSIGAFYGVLTKTGKYKALIDKIASKFKGKEKAFLLGTAFIIAAITSVFDYSMITFIFIPALISIVIAMKYDKITAFMTTFGAYLIGIIGSTINTNVVTTINGFLTDVTVSDGIWFRIILFVLGYALLAYYIIKAKKINKEEEDLFIGEEIHNKYPVWPIISVYAILFVLMVLGCTSWSEMFNVTVFDDLNTTITSWTVGDNELAIAQIILGNISALGEWYYAEMAVMCLLASLITGACYKMKFNEIISNMGQGIMKILPHAALVTLCYAVVYFAGNTMSYPTIAGWILGATSSFNLFLASITTILGSLLHVDMLYVSNYIVAQIAALTTNQALVEVLVQSIYGLTMFVVPTSAMLVLGLSYLNIPYKEWIKKSWMFIIELLAIVLVVLIVMSLI